MERSLLTRRPLRFVFSPPTRPWLSSAPARKLGRMAASASSGDPGGLQWKPLLRMEEAELMADAPSLLKTCAGFDWKAQACELRSLAEISARNALVINHRPSSKLPGKDDGGSSNGHGGSWFAAGIAIAAASLSESAFHLHALAAEDVVQKTEAAAAEAAAAAARAPAWITPAFLAFPVVSYGFFYAYRSQVNPNARVSDWMFGVAAIVIIANLVLISTLGVRLY